MPYAFVRSVKLIFEIKLFIRSIGIGEPAAIPVLMARFRLHYDFKDLKTATSLPQFGRVDLIPKLSSLLDLGQDAEKMSGNTVQGSAFFFNDRVNYGFGIEYLGRINNTRPMGPCCQIS